MKGLLSLGFFGLIIFGLFKILGLIFVMYMVDDVPPHRVGIVLHAYPNKSNEDTLECKGLFKFSAEDWEQIYFTDSCLRIKTVQDIKDRIQWIKDNPNDLMKYPGKDFDIIIGVHEYELNDPNGKPYWIHANTGTTYEDKNLSELWTSIPIRETSCQLAGCY